MKLYKKSDLTVISGMLVCTATNEVVFPSDAVIEQGNELENLYQQALYLNKQPKAVEAPSLDGFKRVSVDDALPIDEFKAVTPVINAKYAEAMAFMDELDEAEVVGQANKMCKKFADLIKFAASDYILANGSGDKHFDMPMLAGDDVLNLSVDTIKKTVAYICGLEEVDEDDDRSHHIKFVEISGDELNEFLEDFLGRDDSDKDSDDEDSEDEGSEE